MQTYRCKHKVEAMHWTDTDEDREAFHTWFDGHDQVFETRGPVIVLPDDLGTAEKGDWVLWSDGEFIVMDDEAFRDDYEIDVVQVIPARTHDADYTRTVLADNEHDDYDWVDLDWYDGPLRSIAMVPRDDLGRDEDLLEVRTLGWQDKHEYQHVRFEREDLQAMLDYIDGKEIRDFQDEPKARSK